MAKKIAPKKTPGKKPQVVVPEVGETQYIVINPAQIEKLEEAVNRLTAVVENKRVYQSIKFPPEFYAGICQAIAMGMMLADQSNRSSMADMARESIAGAAALIAEFGKGRQ